MLKKILISVALIFVAVTPVVMVGASENRYQSQTISNSEKEIARKNVSLPTNYAANSFESGDFALFISKDLEVETITPVNETGVSSSIANYQLVQFVEYDENNAIVYANGEQFLVEVDELYPIDSLAIPYYTVKQDGSLWLHEPINPFEINGGQFDADNYFDDQFVGYTETLETGKKYVSVDGFYFYEIDTTDVLVNETQTSNVTPMFTSDQMKYYTHMSIRTTTSLSPSQIDNYIQYKSDSYSGNSNSGSCFYADNQSALVHDKRQNNNLMNDATTPGELFVNTQNLFGINAAFMVSVALHESCYGFSNYALSRNNFWGWGAVDSDPDAAYGFHSIHEAIPAYAAFLSDFYSDPTYSSGNGMQIGDSPVSGYEWCSGTASSKYSWNYDNYEDGIGKSWATGCGWQNSVANYYASMDSFYNFQDYNDYKFVVVDGNDPIYIKNNSGSMVELKDDSGNDVGNNSSGVQYTYTITGQETINGVDYWKVLPDTPLNTSYKNNSNPFYTSSDVSWRCTDDGNYNSGTMMYCTGATHNDYYNGQDMFYEYKLTSGTTWGHYGYTSTQSYYIKKSDARQTFGSSSINVPSFGGYETQAIEYPYVVKTNKNNVTTFDGYTIPNAGTELVATDIVYYEDTTNIYGLEVIIDTPSQQTTIINKGDLSWDTPPMVIELEDSTTIKSAPDANASALHTTPDGLWGNKIVATHVVQGSNNETAGYSCTYGTSGNEWFKVIYTTLSGTTITTNENAYVSGCYSRDVHKNDSNTAAGSIESVSTDNGLLYIKGYDYIKNYNIPNFEDVTHELILVNTSTDEEIKYSLGDSTRTDITQTIGKQEGYNYDKSGYGDPSGNGISIKNLPNGTYEFNVKTTVNGKASATHAPKYVGVSTQDTGYYNGKQYTINATNTHTVKITVADATTKSKIENVELEDGKLYIKGFGFIDGYNLSDWDSGSHTLILKDQTTGTEYSYILGDSTRTDITQQYGAPYGYNYDKSGFSDPSSSGIDISALPIGNYDVYIETKMATGEIQKEKLKYSGTTKTEYGMANDKQYSVKATNNEPLVISVTEMDIEGNVESITLSNNKLYISGFSFIAGQNCAAWGDCTHSLVFKETTTGQQYKYSLGNSTRTDVTFKYGEPYGYNYDKSGYGDPGGTGIDLRNLPVGSYDIYIETNMLNGITQSQQANYTGTTKSQNGYKDGKHYKLTATNNGHINITVSDVVAKGVVESVTLSNNKLYIKGYSYIDSYNLGNWDSGAHYLILKEQTTGVEYKYSLGDSTRTDVTTSYGKSFGYNYDKSGYGDPNGTGIDMRSLQNGTYDLYIETKMANGTSRKQHPTYTGSTKTQNGYKDGKHYVLSAQNNGHITITKSDVVAKGAVESISLEGSKIHINGYGYIDSYDLSGWESGSHTLMLKNKSTGEEFKYNLGDSTRTDVTASYGKSFGYNYDKSGYGDPSGAGFDISNLPKGTYEFYISTSITNGPTKTQKGYYIGTTKTQTTTANGKTYTLTANNNSTIELVIN